MVLPPFHSNGDFLSTRKLRKIVLGELSKRKIEWKIKKCREMKREKIRERKACEKMCKLLLKIEMTLTMEGY